MEIQEPKKKKNVVLISALVFVVLFVLPLGSLYFLNSGTDYHLKSVAELKELGAVGPFNLLNQNNLPISTEALHGRVAVVNFLSDDIPTARKQTDRIAMVHQAYDPIEDVVFLSFVSKDTSKELIDRAQELGITDDKQWFLIETDNKKDLATGTFHITDVETGVALVDTSMNVRRLYNIDLNADMGRLVEQIPILMPKQKRRGL